MLCLIHVVGILATWLSHDITGDIFILVTEPMQLVLTVKTLLLDFYLGCFRTESKPDASISGPCVVCESQIF